MIFLIATKLVLPAVGARAAKFIYAENYFPGPVQFHRLPYVLPATESWAGAWELDY